MISFVCLFTEKRRDPPNGMLFTVFMSIASEINRREVYKKVRHASDGICLVCQTGGSFRFLSYLATTLYFLPLTLWILCSILSIQRPLEGQSGINEK